MTTTRQAPVRTGPPAGIPIVRYDTCVCGHARFMHAPRGGGEFAGGVPASDIGAECAAFTLATACPA